MRIVITGGAGYIGSHTLLNLLADDHEAIIIDNYVNSSKTALARVKTLSNRTFDHYESSINHAADLDAIFARHRPEAVIHFAGLKAVGESEAIPLTYYDENVSGTISLLKVMDKYGCKKIVFSSSATVYGLPQYLPFDEAHPLQPINPYGRTKYFNEEIIRDWAKTEQDKSAILLRYFNPVGAHETGMIGEDPNGIPNNLIPYIAQVAVGRRPYLQIFGDDYNTHDGTGIRDYIHVSDLAAGHIAALNYAAVHHGIEAINLGTGKGYSVLDMVKAFEAASGQIITYKIMPRRKGDLDQSFADTKKAEQLLGWRAQKTIEQMCADVWRWQQQNPQGYDG